MRQINTLIIDLDDTIYSWFDYWYFKFEPIYKKIIRETGADEVKLYEEIRRINQANGTSEYCFLPESLSKSRVLKLNKKNLERLYSFIDQAEKSAEEKQRLFCGVYEALWRIKKSGTKIIGLTEAQSRYSQHRLKKFGLDGVLDVLYCSPDHQVPNNQKSKKAAEVNFQKLKETKVELNKKGLLKPHKRLIETVLEKEKIHKQFCLYIGDNLMKDVALAQKVGVLDAHAAYSKPPSCEQYSLLQSVSHWTQEMMDEETIIKKTKKIKPSIILESCFEDIFCFCEFLPFLNIGEITKESHLRTVAETWQKTVDVQQHFNDMQMRLRSYAVTIIAAMFAATGFTLDIKTKIIIPSLFSLSVSQVFIMAIALVLLAFYYLDRHSYHTFLQASVNHAEKIEMSYSKILPGIDLGQRITMESEAKLVGAEWRLKWFYIIIAIVLIAVFMALGYDGKETLTKAHN